MTIRDRRADHARSARSRRRRGLALAVALMATGGASNAYGRSVRLHVFDAVALGDYDVQLNGSLVASPTASPQASLVVLLSASAGDRVVVRQTGVTPFVPDAPAALAATGSSDGCVHLAWDTPAPTQYVNAYRVYARPDGSAAITDSLEIDVARVVSAGSRSMFTWCGLPSGTWRLAMRARNGFDLWSAPSNEVVATVTGNDPQPPPPPASVTLSEPTPGCLRAAWVAPGDPTITGYRAYFGRAARAWTDSIDAGGATEATRCGLGGGRWFVAVRSYAAGGRLGTASSPRAIDLAGVDVEPPAFTVVRPADGATGVALDADVELRVSDAGAGVDSATIRVTIDGSPAVVHAVRSGDGWYVQALPAAPLPAASRVSVVATASDRASPPNAGSRAWSFTTGAAGSGDAAPPEVALAVPAAGARLRTSQSLRVRVRDAGSGVDLGRLVMRVDGALVAPIVSGDASDVLLDWRPAGGWTAGSRVRIEVDACDVAGNCAAPFAARVDVESAAMAALAEGAIVPDGYWAGDPTRPLEIRDLPAGWAVAIYDVTGVAVRRFRNRGATPVDWTWDFRNDAGRRVVRGVYLVRVLDEVGGVRRRGRFVVQNDG